MKLGANSVLFGAFDMEAAFKYLAMAGYDGIELSAIPGMSEHLVLERWRDLAPAIKDLSRVYGLELLAMEQPSQDPERMETAFQAAVELGVPVVTLCVKAHVGASIYNTPTTLRVMEEIGTPSLGIDMDPSHIHRSGENPVEALEAVISRIRHVHIRDCKGRQQGPGDPEDQANGRGDIDLVNYIRLLHEYGYAGAVDLEVIGTKRLGYSLEQCCVIAAEARGHMQACLQACGAR
jgi:sugar phosphate isomerase/epimerase